MGKRVGWGMLLCLVLAGCGGGGGGGGSSGGNGVIRPTFAGAVTPLSALPEVTSVDLPGYGFHTNRTDMLLPPLAGPAAYALIIQTSTYGLDASALPALKVNSATLSSPVTDTAIAIQTGAAYSLDATLGQWSHAAVTTAAGGSGFSAILNSPTFDTAGSQQIATYTSSNITTTTIAYVLPQSATLNPNGFVYQTYGEWATVPLGTSTLSESWFSLGIPTPAATLPLAGTASYSGTASATYVDFNREPNDVEATMNATVNFGTRSVSLSTTGSTSLSNNAPTGTAATASPGLNLNGTLTYVAGSNTFSGAVATASGMNGNAAGRFYGAGIAVATPTKVVGAPPEIGGTFAVMNTTGSMQGAFGGK